METMEKMYKSNHNTCFENELACILDNQTKVIKFKELYTFLKKFDKNAITEWCNIRNFDDNLCYIVEVLERIGILY